MNVKENHLFVHLAPPPYSHPLTIFRWLASIWWLEVRWARLWSSEQAPGFELIYLHSGILPLAPGLMSHPFLFETLFSLIFWETTLKLSFSISLLCCLLSSTQPLSVSSALGVFPGLPSFCWHRQASLTYILYFSVSSSTTLIQGMSTAHLPIP